MRTELKIDSSAYCKTQELIMGDSKHTIQTIYLSHSQSNRFICGGAHSEFRDTQEIVIYYCGMYQKQYMCFGFVNVRNT